MNDFVVTLLDKKRNIKVNDDIVTVNDKSYDIKLSKINNHCYLLKVGNQVFDITTTKINNERYGFLLNGHYYEADVRTKLREKAIEYLKNKKSLSHHDEVKAPMPGLVLKLMRKAGDKINQGDSIAVLEAMKMENDLRAPTTGIIKEIHVSEGASVEKGTLLFTIE